MYSGYIGIMGMLHDFQLIAATLTMIENKFLLTGCQIIPYWFIQCYVVRRFNRTARILAQPPKAITYHLITITNFLCCSAV
jgi:hypothetical protein